MDAPSPPPVSYIISLEFRGTSDVVLTIGPLIITSVNAEDGYWGSFEINWENKGWFYCHFFEDVDPYKGCPLGTGVPEWLIERTGDSYPLRKKLLWTSLTWFGSALAWHERLMNRLRRT
jgi:hypothetical protein